MVRAALAVFLLLAWPSAALAQWHEASSAHFVVYSKDRPERLRQFATNLERFDKALRVAYGRPDPKVGPANRITVFVVDDQSDIRKLAGSSSAAGFYVPRAGGSVAFVPRNTDGGDEDWSLSAVQILLHEYTHHFLLTEWPHAAYPRWFSEGFSEFYATAKFDKDGSVVLGHPPQYRAYEVMGIPQMPVEKLIALGRGKLRSDDIAAIYGRGWLLTHYLTMEPAREGQLNAYLRAINQGQSPIEAASVFGDLKALDRELARYRTSRFAAMRVAAKALEIAPVTLRPLNAAEAATIEVRLRSKRGVDAKTAPGVYERAKRATAAWPNDPAAQLVLAEAAFDAGDHAAALAAAERVIAADPKAVDGWLYKAMAETELAKKAEDKRSATWTAIRRSIATANKLDTENPQPLILYYTSFIEAGQPPSASARNGLRYAFDLAPHDRVLRMNVAQSLIEQGDTKAARELLMVLASDPHAGELGDAAVQLIDGIDGKSPAQGDKAPAAPEKAATKAD